MSRSAFAIFGAGPAGLMAADRLSADGHAVTIYERMPSPARKFLLAGRGGLNLTHSEDFETFLTRYREAAPVLRMALESFGPDRLRDWVEALGEATFIGSSGRVFPKSFKASPLLRAWLRRLDRQGVSLKTRHRFAGWDANGALSVLDPTGAALTINPDATLLALGGASWPRLGADGGWVAPLRDAGIAVTTLQPANGGVRVAWSPVLQRFEGTPLKRIAVSFGKETVRGEAMVTQGGLEGGAVYALSASLRQALEAGAPQILTIDLRPDIGEDELQKKLGAPRGRQSLSTRLRKQVGLSPAAVALLHEGRATPLPAEPAALAALIKRTPLAFTAMMPLDRAISSAGGIALHELTNDFMLRRKPGVFAAGEMLDWEAPTGGYLLQACFSTALAAASGMLMHAAGGGPVDGLLTLPS